MPQENLARATRLGIGPVAELLGLTPRAIRHYESVGLLEVGRDRLNCRYYDGAARMRLAWIASYRAAGLSLSEIEKVLAIEEDRDGWAECAKEMLLARRARIAAQLAQADAMLEHLNVSKTSPPPGSRGTGWRRTAAQRSG